MKKRFVVAMVAGALLAAMLPGVATAQGSSAADASTFVIPAPDYVWDGRLASVVTRDYIWDRRLASAAAPDYVWDGRLASVVTRDYIWDRRLASAATPVLALAD